MGFLELEGKNFLVMGVANKKSVAWHITQVLQEEGARVLHSVQNEEAKEKLSKFISPDDMIVCDVEKQEDIDRLADEVKKKVPSLNGMVHSIAFANFSEGLKPFNETLRKDFLQAVDISCFSLVATSNALKSVLDKDASVVTISISTTRMASENYGYMGPIKAALDSAIVFLAKSFSAFSNIRFNAVKAGLLKTSASAGIPGYINAYLYAENLTLRKSAIQTREVAKTAAFLLSPASSGINTQGIVVDAGMSVNYFDTEIIKKATRD